MAKIIDIRKIDGLWCDDITFCRARCEMITCPRNQKNIRDRSVPHSFSVGLPTDCPRKMMLRIKAAKEKRAK